MTFYEYLSIPRSIASYLEIGVQEGHSLRAVVTANPSLETIVVCDDWGATYGGTGRGSHDHINELLREIGYEGDVEYLDGDSKALLKSLQGRKFDLILVDGDHSEFGAETDLYNADAVLAEGGIVVVHDTANQKHPEIREVVERFIELTGRTVEHHDVGEGFAVIR